MIYSNCLSSWSFSFRLPRPRDPRNDLAFYKLYVIGRGAQQTGNGANRGRLQPDELGEANLSLFRSAIKA